MRYRDAFDRLDGFGIPRLKYAPEHWLTRVYFAGRCVGARVRQALTRSPLSMLIKGIRDGWGWDD